MRAWPAGGPIRTTGGSCTSRSPKAGRQLVEQRRAVRAERLSGLLAQLSQADQEALAAALPAMQALASLKRDGTDPY